MELMKRLRELRDMGVKRVVFEGDSIRELEFFASSTAPPGEEPDEEQTEEPEVPMGYLNAAGAFRPKKRAG